MTKNRAVATSKSGYNNIHEDSSWITSPNSANGHSKCCGIHEKTKQLFAMKAMTQAFRESMRCSLKEAESKTTQGDQIDCIHFGNLLVALDAMRDCMKTYGMTRTTTDLEYHCAKARLLYRATPPESRDFLSCLLLKPSTNSTTQQHESTTNQPLPLMRAFSTSPESSPTQKLFEHTASSETVFGSDASNATTANHHLFMAASPAPAAAAAMTTPQKTTTATKDESMMYKDGEYSSPYLPQVDATDREMARKSMFWLCYFVRYTYNVHRYSLRLGYDSVDASPMAFMRYLQPYFGDYYTEQDDAKSYLKLLADYRTEHFLGDTSSSSNTTTTTKRQNDALDSQSRQELKVFLGVLEVVMYLWTPAFREMALQGGVQWETQLLR